MTVKGVKASHSLSGLGVLLSKVKDVLVSGGNWDLATV